MVLLKVGCQIVNNTKYFFFFFFVIFLVDAQPDTHEVDQSEIRTQILLANASSAQKGRKSFTHMLTEVRPQRRKLKYKWYQRAD